MSKSFAAGILIGIACINLCLVGGTIGNITFAFALLCICTFDLPLFTGRVGDTKLTAYNCGTLFGTLIANICGTMIVSILFAVCWRGNIGNYDSIVTAKQGLNALQVITRAMGCGFLMQCAVTAFKKGFPLLCGMCVFVFLQLGFEHCIANAFFIATTWRYAGYMALYVFGNATGAKTAHGCGIRKE